MNKIILLLCCVLSLIGCAVDSENNEKADTSSVKQQIWIRHIHLNGNEKPTITDEKIEITAKPDFTKLSGELGVAKSSLLSVSAPSCGDDLIITSEEYGDGYVACISGYGGLETYYNYFPSSGGQTLGWRMHTVANFKNVSGPCVFTWWGYDPFYGYYRDITTSFYYNEYTWTAGERVVDAYDIYCYQW